MSEAPVQITAHGEGWHDIPYIRADVAAAQLAERDARIAELEAALIQIKEHKCETYTTGDCLAHVGRYIGSPYTFNAICDTCVANYALRGEFEKLPRWTPDVVNAV